MFALYIRISTRTRYKLVTKFVLGFYQSDSASARLSLIMDTSAAGNESQFQRRQSTIAFEQRPVDDPPNPDISKSADPEDGDYGNEECARKAAEMQALRYNPLEGPNIRLITIDPAIQDGKLELTMEQVPLTDGLDFHVLSYVWGDPTNKKTIIVNGQQLDVTQNLYDFLETARQNDTNFLSYHEHVNYRTLYTTEIVQAVAGSSGGKVSGPASKPMQFWVDAICINQNDMSERNEQVPRMGDIYSMASRVWIWIGLPSNIFSEDSDLRELKRALNYSVQDSFKQPTSHDTIRPPDTPLIEQFAEYQRQMILENTLARLRAMGFVLEPGPTIDMMHQQYAQFSSQISSQHTHTFFNKFLQQLASLLTQPYFQRVWIIQEYVLNPREPIALLGHFVLDLQHVLAAVLRLSREVHSMNEHSKALTFAAVSQTNNLMALHQARMQWHGFPRDHKPKGSLTLLSPGERLSHLLQNFSNRRCTNPVDQFYGILGLFSQHDLPRSLLPNYSLPVEQVSQAYTRYIIESTGNLEIIESSKGHESADCPSWVGHAESLTSRFVTQTTVSRGKRTYSFSDDGRRLTLQGTFIGKVLKCSCTDCPGERTGEHLKYLDDTLFEKATQITGKPKSEIFKSWLNAQLDVHTMLPSSFRNFDSMQDILQRYREVCEGIPLEALDGLNRGSITQKHIIFKTPCRDPEFLYAVFRLADPRFCVLSTGDILMCLLKHTDTNVMSRTHGEDDCAWALKGLHLPAIIRPKDEAYEYCGPLLSCHTMLKDAKAKREKHDLFLDDEFFEVRKVQPVTLI